MATETEIKQIQTDADRTKALDAPVVRASDQGFRLQSGDDDYRIRFGGLAQVNGRFFTSGNDKDLSSTFYVNKARPIISGAIAKYWEFQMMPDFGQGKVVCRMGGSTPAILPRDSSSSASIRRTWIWSASSPTQPSK